MIVDSDNSHAKFKINKLLSMLTMVLKVRHTYFRVLPKGTHYGRQPVLKILSKYVKQST